MNRLNYLSILTLLCLFFAFHIAAAQQLEYAIPAHYYGPDEGLPSSELHRLLQDKKGFLWIASDNGLIRFDGKNFKHYTADEGLSNLVIFQLTSFGDDNLCAALDNSLYLLGGDSIHLIDQNFIIKNQLSAEDMPNDLDVLPDGSLMIGSSTSGPLLITADGNPEQLSGFNGNEIYVTELTNGFNIGTRKRVDLNSKLKITLDLKSGKEEVILPQIQLMKGPSRILRWNDALVLSNGKQLMCFVSGEIRFHRELPQDINSLETDPRYGLMLGTAGNGIQVYKTFEELEKDQFEHWMPGKFISDILVMTDGEVFVSTLNSGLASIPSPSLKFLEAENFYSTLCTQDEGILLASRTKGLFNLQDGKDELNPLYSFDGPITAIYGNSPEFGTITSSYGTGLLNSEGFQQITCSDSLELGGAIKFYTGRNNKLWLALRNGYAALDLKSGKCIDSLSTSYFQHRVLAVHEQEDGQLWVGTADGLFHGRHNKLKKTSQLGDILLKGRIEDIIELEDGILVFAVKGQGLIFMKNEGITLYDLSKGLISNIIEDLENHGSEELFIATASGVQRLFMNGTEVLRSSYLNKNLGLLSNEVNQVLWHNSEVLALGPKGISVISQWPELDKGPRFHISAVQTNQGTFLPSETIQIESPNNSLRIDFNGISFKEADKLLFRYRLKNDSIWHFTANNSISISDLDPGEYSLHIQAGNGLVWGDEDTVNFNIEPALWQTWWSKVILYLFLAFFLFLFGRWVFGRLRKDDLLEKRLGYLERSALLAQMNPHFVFNSLNSIQSYIAKNENDKAIRFLAKFSRLIRSTLNHSRAPRVNLQSELEALTLYLDLEQMRFKDKFDYEITVDQEIDPYDFMLPPLLIQPYLENAIIHGLSKKDGKGRIELFYLLQKNHLVVTVTDNGIGIEQSKKEKQRESSLHKSVGMTITQKRLELLDEKRNDKKVNIEEVKDSKGNVLGTKVEVKIKINEGETV